MGIKNIKRRGGRRQQGVRCCSLLVCLPLCSGGGGAYRGRGRGVYARCILGNRVNRALSLCVKYQPVAAVNTASPRVRFNLNSSNCVELGRLSFKQRCGSIAVLPAWKAYIPRDSSPSQGRVGRLRPDPATRDVTARRASDWRRALTGVEGRGARPTNHRRRSHHVESTWTRPQITGSKQERGAAQSLHSPKSGIKSLLPQD